MAKENPLASNLTLEQQKNLFGNAYLNMLWHCPTDQRFPYWVHLPDCYYDEKDPHYKLLKSSRWMRPPGKRGARTATWSRSASSLAWRT